MINSTPTNFSLDLRLSDGEIAKIFIPQPLESELILISRVLSYFFNQMDETPLNVFVADWQRMVNEALSDLREKYAEKVKNDIDRFLERQIAGGFCDIKDINSFNDIELSDLKGLILFTCALYRYVWQRTQIKSGGIEALFTSLTLAEWKQSLTKQPEASMGENAEVMSIIQS